MTTTDPATTADSLAIAEDLMAILHRLNSADDQCLASFMHAYGSTQKAITQIISRIVGDDDKAATIVHAATVDQITLQEAMDAEAARRQADIEHHENTYVQANARIRLRRAYRMLDDDEMAGLRETVEIAACDLNMLTGETLVQIQTRLDGPTRDLLRELDEAFRAASGDEAAMYAVLTDF